MKPEKLISGRNYGHVPHLSGSRLGEHDTYIHAGQEAIITQKVRSRRDRVIITRKLDGTNVGILRRGRNIIALQRKGYRCDDSPYEQHLAFAAYIASTESFWLSFLSDGERLVGEWLWQASGIRYHITGIPFFAFDLFVDKKSRVPYEDLCARCRSENVRMPELLADSKGSSIALTDLPGPTEFIDESIKPVEEGHEGLVARVENKGIYDFMAKWVRADFTPGKFLPGIGREREAEIVINELPDFSITRFPGKK